LRPYRGGNISYALGRDRLIRFLYEALAKATKTEAAVSTIRLVFLKVFHMPC
jgi:hypothetical protein